MKKGLNYISYISSPCIFICYMILYNQVVDHGGSLPINFQMPNDLSESYALLNSISLESISMMILLIFFYGLYYKKIQNRIKVKYCYMFSMLYLILILLGIIAFKQGSYIGTTRTTVIFLVNMLSILFMKKGIISLAFFAISVFPILDSLVCSLKDEER